MRRSVLWVFALIVAIAAVPAAAQFSRTPSAQLVQTLSTLRGLSSGSFQQVLWWASNPRDPGITVPDWNNAERRIMQLGHNDRNAVLSWLTGNGRRALYERGATDSMIGPRRSIDTSYTPPTPNPLEKYHVSQLTSETMRGTEPPKSGIDVLKGFALVAKDGTKAIVCVSFKNLSDKTAKSIHFVFPLLDAQGDTVGSIDFERRGTFSPNIAIDGPSSPQNFVDPGLSHRGAFDNCVTNEQGTAALPLLRTRHVAYKVAGVTYADGSSWP